MALSYRLFGQSLLRCNGLRCISSQQCKQVILEPREAVAPCPEGHDERNMRLNRPMSPHLTIYKFQLPANLSITHRFTGMILSGYAATFATISLLSDKPMLEIINNISTCYPNFFMFFKIGLILPFCYHFFNGIRHLVWDTGCALTMKGVYITGYLMLFCALLSAAFLVYYAEELKRQEEERLRKLREEEERLRQIELQAAEANKTGRKGRCDKKKPAN